MKTVLLSKLASTKLTDQISDLFLCLFLINQSIRISAALKVQKLWDYTSNDEDMSAVNIPLQFVSSLSEI